MVSSPRLIWMEVDIFNKELPIRIADSAAEMSRLTGVKETNIRISASRARRGGIRRFRSVWIGDLEDEE